MYSNKRFYSSRVLKCYYDNKSRALEHFYTANSDLMSKRDYNFFLK